MNIRPCLTRVLFPAFFILIQVQALSALPAAPVDSSFEIYYVAGSKAKTVTKLDTVPFLNMADIKQYDYRHHTIVLEREAYDHFVRAIPQVIGKRLYRFCQSPGRVRRPFLAPARPDLCRAV